MREAFEEEDEAMAFFKRRKPVRQGARPNPNAQHQPFQRYENAGTTQQPARTDAATQPQSTGDGPQYADPNRNPQYAASGNASQYADSSGSPQRGAPNTAAQRGDPGTAAQRGDPGTAAQYRDANLAQQHEDPGGNPRSERGVRANQAVGTQRTATRRPRGLPGGWLGEIVLGLATVVIGLIVVFHPMHTLNVLAILLGVLLVISGVYHVVRSMRSAGDHRMWGGIAGVLFILTGIFLLRHVGLTLALIALFAGFAFIIAGIAGLAEAISGHGRMGRLWSAVFGVICVFAGIAAITTPIHTLARLAIVLGWAFFAMGIMHIIGAIVSRRSAREALRQEPINVPGQRTTEPTDAEGGYSASPEARAAASSAAPGHRRSRL